MEIVNYHEIMRKKFPTMSVEELIEASELNEENAKKYDILRMISGGPHRVTFSDGRKLTYIHNPKTAGMSIHHWLIKNFPNAEHEFLRGHRHTLETIKFFDDEAGFVFSFVRNPWDWWVSRYRHYINTHQPCDWHFADFIHIANYGLSGKLVHSLAPPRFDLYADGCDLILRYENIEEEFNKIQRMLNCYDPLPKRNLNEVVYDRRGHAAHYSLYYNDELRDVVEYRHKTFIEKWGYKFEDKRKGKVRQLLK